MCVVVCVSTEDSLSRELPGVCVCVFVCVYVCFYVSSRACLYLCECVRTVCMYGIYMCASH